MGQKIVPADLPVELAPCRLTSARYPAYIGAAKLVSPQELAVQVVWSAQT